MLGVTGPKSDFWSPVFWGQPLRPDYLLAFRADPDQVHAPPDAPLAAFEVPRQGSERQRSEGPGSSIEVAEAFKELAQAGWFEGSEEACEKNTMIEHDRSHSKSIF